jgi:predicted DNA-binding protein
MARRPSSAVVTLRVPDDLDRRIAREARRRRRTKSELVREALETAFGESSAATDPAAEARRQSLLVSGRKSEAEALDFSVAAADTRGWR